jgi:hypothetical protein
MKRCKVHNNKREEEVANNQYGNKQKASKIKRPIHKLFLATFMAPHNSCSSKAWHKL